jgi:DNA-binding NarL/FixJ family response regulator
MNAIPALATAPAHGRLRVMIVDQSPEYASALRRTLAAALPDVEVTEYDPSERGIPEPAFDWSAYDAVLLDSHVGTTGTGLDWLKSLRQRAHFPPAIVMSADGNEYLAARAIKLGAHDYIRKQDITCERIGALIADAVSEARSCTQFDATLREERGAPALAILDRLAPRSARASMPPGTVGYRFVRLIGQGSSSRVYLAERSTDATTLVLKVIDIRTVQDGQVVERFIREAEIASAIDSPYVVHFHDYGLTQAYGYIAMEFFTRGDLKQRLEMGVKLSDAPLYLRHIALGLDAIHRRGIVHRDLKPGNIMFRADDSLALADFGISKRLNQTSELTNLGSVIGTPNYLSPEQAMGQPVDHRADLYSAGVILYEMLAGHKPFRAESASALVYQHVHAEVPALPPAARRYENLVGSLLAKHPDDRLPSAAALVTALDALR